MRRLVCRSLSGLVLAMVRTRRRLAPVAAVQKTVDIVELDGASQGFRQRCLQLSGGRQFPPLGLGQILSQKDALLFHRHQAPAPAAAAFAFQPARAEQV